MEVLDQKVDGVETVKDDIKQEEIDKLVEELAQKRAIELTNNAVAERVRKLNEKHELEKQQAIEDALKKAKMTVEELEAEEVRKLAEKNAELEQKYNELVNSGLIKSKLSEAGLPQTDALVKSLLNNVNEIDDIVKELKDNFDTELQKRVDEKLKTSTIDFKQQTVDLTKPETRHRNTASRIGVA